MNRNGFFFLLGAVPFLLFTACQNFPTPLSTSRGLTSETPISGQLLAQVDDWRIGTDDFEKAVEAITQEAVKEDKDFKATRELKVALLQDLVTNALLAVEAKRRGFDKDRIIAELVNSYERTLLAAKLKQQLDDDFKKSIYVSETEIRNYYKDNKDKMGLSIPDIDTYEIAVKDKETANALYVRLFQGESFDAIARSNSILGSGGRGGALGYINPRSAQRFQKFWEVAYAQEPGDVSKPFDGEDGKWYIILVKGKREGAGLSAEVHDMIKKGLENRKKYEKLQEVASAAKTKVRKYEVNDNLLK
ncbi:MAG: peptidyl-prolyl cis-trans isomerase [Candidatus Omnitrophota bacterium]|nr:peptidyl-prolyl cis-trans isomerase [Candidatus Omnitrophota bacterium]